MKENSRDIDSELIKKAKKGNHGAFNILMNKYYPRVYASIFSFIICIFKYFQFLF